MAKKPCIVVYNGERYTPERFMAKMMDGSFDRYIFPEEAVEGAPATKAGAIEREKGILSSMYKAVPMTAQQTVQRVGLKYKVASKQEARKIASQILKDLGVDEALDWAFNTKLSGDIRSFLFNLSLNELSRLENSTSDIIEKREYAEKIANAMISYDEAARDYGRFNSAIYDFYLSPLGLEYYENKKRERAFVEEEKKYSADWKEVFEEIKNQPEFKALVEGAAAEMFYKSNKQKAKTVAAKIKNVANKIRKEGLSAVLPSFLKGPDAKGIQQKGLVNVDEVIATALEAIANTLEVAGNLADVVKEQAKKIKAVIKDADESEIAKWLTSQFVTEEVQQKSLEEKIKEREESLEKQIKKWKDKIASGIITQQEKEEISGGKIKQLEEELKEVKKAYYEARKDFPSYKQKMAENYLNRMRKKLAGLNEEQKGEVIRRAVKKLTESGALEYEDFRQIIGEVLGIKMDEETAKQFRQNVQDINALNDALDEYVKDPSKANEKKLVDAEAKAIDARRKLANVVYNDVALSRTLKSAMQLTAIGIPTILKNFTWNLGTQSIIRFPANAVVSVADRILYTAFSRFGYKRTQSMLSGEQKAFFGGLKQGVSEGADNMLSGISSKEYFEKEVYVTPIKPIDSAKDLLEWAKGNKSMKFKEIVDKLIKASPTGYYMEFVSRSLTFFDKPLRYAAEKAKAQQIGSMELKLSKEDMEVFLRAPKQFAVSYYIGKGLSNEDAESKADSIVDRITEQGSKSVAQQNNFISDALTAIGKALDNAAEDRPIAKTALATGRVVTAPVSLFIKTPANIAWQVFNLINPEFAVLQALMHSFNAYNKRKKGDESYKIDVDRAKDWMGTAATGAALGTLTAFLANIGAIESEGDEEQKKKERKAVKEYSKGGTVNMSKLYRYFSGEPEDKSEPDYLLDLSWLGQLGAYMDMSNRMLEFTKSNPDAGYLDETLDKLGTSSKMAIAGSVLNSASVISQAVTSYDGAQSYLVNGINTYANIIQPQTFAQQSRALIDYEYRVKADGFLAQLNNSFTARSSMYRRLTNQMPPSDIGLWGDSIPREGNAALRFFGISAKSKDNFAQPIYNDFERTEDTEFLPSAVTDKIKVKGEEVELKTEQMRELEKFIGQERKKLVSPYVNDYATLKGYGRYNEIKDDELKKEALQIIYDKGYDRGVELFKKKYPEYKTSKLTGEEKREQKKDSRRKKAFGKQLEKIK
jgi:hypothetical protein